MYEIGLDYRSGHFELPSFGNEAANLKSRTLFVKCR